MLEDREPSVKAAKQMASTLQKTVDPREQKGIQNQISQLDQRFDMLKNNAGNRLDTLEQVVNIAKEFQDVQDPVATWLDSVEKKFASLEPTAMDTESIENIITSLNVSRMLTLSHLQTILVQSKTMNGRVHWSYLVVKQFKCLSDVFVIWRIKIP